MVGWLAGVLVVWTLAASAGVYYVDPLAVGANDGSTWSNAWNTLGAVKGVQGGDTVYLSGGPTGSSRNYSLASAWLPVGGTNGTSVTYQIGQDPLHNGMAIFNCQNGLWSGNSSYVTISGDAGDGQRHLMLTNCGYALNATHSTNLTISYVNLGLVNEGNVGDAGALDLGSGSSGFQLDHCYCVVWDASADHFSYASFTGGGFDVNRAFCNTILVPRTAAQLGADVFQWNGGGFSIYSNTCVGYTTNYTGRQHQDGVQPTSGSYIKIYNNVFNNLANSDIFLDAYYGDFSHVRIYNNVCEITDPVMVSNPNFYPEGITVSPDAGVYATIGRWPQFTDIIVCNNTIADIFDIGAIAFPWPYNNASATYLNCLVENNVAINCNNNVAPQFWLGDEIITGSNISLTPSGGGVFNSYSPYSVGNDFHLRPGASVLNGTGNNLIAAYFTTDKDGNPRPNPPSIGAYETNSVTTNAPPWVGTIGHSDNPIGASGSVLVAAEGSTVQYSITAFDPNGLPLSWQWSYSSNGAPAVNFLSGTGAVAAISYTYPVGSAGSQYIWNLQVNNGYAVSQAQAQVVVMADPGPDQALALEAPLGAVLPPMVVTNGYVYQPTPTLSPTNGGRVTYTFAVSNAGNYVIQAFVNTVDPTGNSAYVNLDAEPQDPGMIWDVIGTVGFERRYVGWRGNSTNNAYAPQVFYLTNGVHQLIVRGRGANLQWQRILIQKAPVFSGTARAF